MNEIDLQIEKIRVLKNLTYIDSLLLFAEINRIEAEDLLSDVHPNIISEIKAEFVARNMVKGMKSSPSLTKLLKRK